MRVVIDTNVLVSGLFFNGPPYAILEAWRDGELRFVASNSILSEYARTIQRLSKKYPVIDISSFFDLLTVKAEIVAESFSLEPVSRHQPDDKFLVCALTGKVSIIISGDAHLLELNPFLNVEILSPSAFVRRFLKSK